MKRRAFLIRITAAVIAAALALPLVGCVSASIREDEVKEELPPIDPEDGVARELNVVCYFRLKDEGCLVPVSRKIAVRAGERTELAVIRGLIDGAPDENQSVAGAFIDGTEVTEVTLDGDILNVTLSSNFMSRIYYDIAEYEAKSALSNGEITEEECAARIADALDELHLSRQLALYSIVNTLTGYGGSIKVQFLVDNGAAGTSRITEGDLGKNGGYASQFDPLGALSFDGSYVATQELITEYFLGHLQRGEYELAYRLISVAGDGAARPTYANFQKDIASAGAVKSFEITGSETHEDSAWVNVRVTLTDADGAERTAEFEIDTVEEDGFRKIGYKSFREGMVNAG